MIDFQRYRDRYSRAEIILAHLRTTPAGSPSRIAGWLGVRRDDPAFREALELALQEGVYVVQGSTRDRFYARQGRPLRIALICPKCDARNFGDWGWHCPDHGIGIWQRNAPYFIAGKPGLRHGHRLHHGLSADAQAHVATQAAHGGTIGSGKP